MKKYRRKEPLTFNAVQWTGTDESLLEVQTLAAELGFETQKQQDNTLNIIWQLVEVMHIGDWFVNFEHHKSIMTNTNFTTYMQEA